jgi:hypothetical protein
MGGGNQYNFSIRCVWFLNFQLRTIKLRARFILSETLYNPHKYCKISTIGGLAQLVEQRTRSIS